MTVSLAALDALADSLTAVEGIKSASHDPAKVNSLPGVWLRFDGFGTHYLNGDTDLRVVLHLIVPDNGYARSAAALIELYNAVESVIDPTGDVTPQAVVLPSAPNALPGLAYPTEIPGATP